jgi:diguanylate cyclase (GGDEF)-like protein/PAS domain S-box-containing protein
VSHVDPEPDDVSSNARAHELPDDLYVDILRGSPELVLVFGDDLRCRFCSESVRETSGYEPSMVVGEYLTRIVARDQHDEVTGAAHMALATPGTPHTVDFRARYTDGWHQVQARLRAVEHNGERYLILSSRDVSDERDRVAALDRKNQLEALLDRVQQTFIDLRAGDIDDSIHWALEETGRFLGADRAYLLRYDFDAKTESMTHEWNAERTEPELSTYQGVRFDLNPAGMDMSLKGEIIAVRDLHDAPERFAGDVPFLLGTGLVSLLEFPIVIRGVTAGSLGFDWTADTATWTDDDLPVLNLFAATFAQLLARQAAEEERERLLQQLLHVFERSPAALALIDRSGVLLQVNDELCRMVGHDASELVGQFAGVLLRPEHLERCIAWGAGFVTGDAANLPGIEAEVQTGHGKELWVDIKPRGVRGEDGELHQIVLQIQDVTARRRAEVAQATSDARLVTILEHLPDPVLRIGMDHDLLFMNQIARELLKGFGAVIDGERHVEEFRAVIDRAVRDNAIQTGIFEMETPDGERVYEARFVPEPGPDGMPVSVLLVGSDLTERRRTQAELEHQASHDPLTELPNRNLFLAHLHSALDALARNRRGLAAVLFFDLDRFKVVNDSMGHAAGDELLRAVAWRLDGALRRDDVVARLGGDEFTVLLGSCRDLEQITFIANRLQAAIAEPLLVAGRELVVSASVGVSVASTGQESPDELMRWADAAMYRAKDLGRNRVVMFDDTLAAEAQRRLDLDQRLRHAVDHHEFEVWFQPEVDLETGEIVGAEALIRWITDAGMRSANEFIWLAEETGLIVPMGNWVLEEACHWTARWQRPDRDLLVRVNLSARQFDQPDLVEIVAGALSRSGLPPEALCLEITETALMENAEASRAMLVQLDQLGVQLAIDDFGTGYSSLAYLKQFPVDVLKIDRTFVDGLPDDAEDMAIVTTILRLAESLGMIVTAEGIETTQQAATLLGLGCRLGQGYLFARPMPAIEMQTRLDARVSGRS